MNVSREFRIRFKKAKLLAKMMLGELRPEENV